MNIVVSGGLNSQGYSRPYPKILFQRIRHDALPPFAPLDGDAGYDFLVQADVALLPHVPVQVPTGVAFAIPYGHAGLVLGRSGNAFKRSIFVEHHGLIDSSYRGEIIVLLINRSSQPLYLTRGDKFAQMIIIPVQTYPLEEVRDLPTTERGANGFGSSGMTGVTQKL